MATHEVAMNAVKHVAFAALDGWVDIIWTAKADEDGRTHVQFRWREHCPEIDTKLARKGYGTRVLEAVFGDSLNGRSARTLHLGGAELVPEFKV